MALTYTPGGTTDNSYSSIAIANAYFDGTLREQTWLSFSQNERETALISATQQIENLGGVKKSHYAGRLLFSGTPYIYTQALHFPRTNDTYSVNNVATTYIPSSVQASVIEQAYFLLNETHNPQIIDVDNMRTNGISTIGLDGVSVNLKPSRRPNGICEQAWILISPYITKLFKVTV